MATIMVVPAHIVGLHGSFNRIRQMALIFTPPSNTWFLCPTRLACSRLSGHNQPSLNNPDTDCAVNLLNTTTQHHVYISHQHNLITSEMGCADLLHASLLSLSERTAA